MTCGRADQSQPAVLTALTANIINGSCGASDTKIKDVSFEQGNGRQMGDLLTAADILGFPPQTCCTAATRATERICRGTANMAPFPASRLTAHRSASPQR